MSVLKFSTHIITSNTARPIGLTALDILVIMSVSAFKTDIILYFSKCSSLHVFISWIQISQVFESLFVLENRSLMGWSVSQNAMNPLFDMKYPNIKKYQILVIILFNLLNFYCNPNSKSQFLIMK